jgi:uncharacterized membrane protein YkvA (DUF1232 family)
MMANPVGSAGDKAGIITEVVRNARLAWRLFRDPRVSGATKLIIPGLAAAYLLFPADLLPDLIPGLGQLDDLAVIVLAIKLFVDRCPQWLVQAHRDELAGVPDAVQTPQASHGGQTVDGEYRVIK